MIDLPRTALLFSQLWLASMLAMPLTIAVAGLAGPGLKLAHCGPCAAASSTTSLAARQPPAFVVASRRA